mgnify:CR=1 FL=1
MYLCRCGKDLQFMGYTIRRGLDPLLIEVGCPECNSKCYIVANSRKEVEQMPRMNQIDFFKVYRYGKYQV